MRSSKDFENEIKQIADQSSTPPPAFIWDNIEDAIQPKRKKRIFFWFFFFGFLMSSLGAWFLFSKDKEIKKLNHVSDHEIILKDQNLNLHKDIHEEINTHSALSQKITDQNNIAKNNLAANTVDSYSDQSSDNLRASVVKNKQASLRIEDKTSLINDKKIEKSESMKMLEPDFKTSTAFAEWESSTKNEVSDHEKHLKESNQLGKKDHQILLDISDKKGRELLQVDRLAVLNAKLDVQNEIPMEVFYLEEVTSNESTLDRFFIELGTFVGKHQKTFDFDGESSYLTARHATESEWYAWGVLSNFGYSLNKNLYLSTGFEFSQYKDLFYYEEDQIQSILLTNPLVENADTSFVQGRYFSEGEMKFNSFEIPITLGLQKQKDNWRFGLELSAYFNFRFSANGKFLYRPTAISRMENEIPEFKDGLGMAYKSSLVFSRYFKKLDCTLSLKPSYKFYQDQIQVPNLEFQSRLSLARIDVSLKKSF